MNTIKNHFLTFEILTPLAKKLSICFWKGSIYNVRIYIQTNYINQLPFHSFTFIHIHVRFNSHNFKNRPCYITIAKTIVLGDLVEFPSNIISHYNPKSMLRSLRFWPSHNDYSDKVSGFLQSLSVVECPASECLEDFTSDETSWGMSVLLYNLSGSWCLSIKNTVQFT